MQCNFRTTCIRKPVLKFVTFARLTTVPGYPCGISLPRITVKTCKRLSEEKSRLNSFEDESRLNLQGKGAIRYLLRNLTKPNFWSMATQPSSLHSHHRNRGRWRRPSHLQCCDVRLWEPYTSNALSRPFLFYPFCFPVWARRDYRIKGEQWFNDLEVVYIQNLPSWKKRPQHLQYTQILSNMVIVKKNQIRSQIKLIFSNSFFQSISNPTHLCDLCDQRRSVLRQLKSVHCTKITKTVLPTLPMSVLTSWGFPPRYKWCSQCRQCLSRSK